jgi:transcriptional regulator with XRE-family HTH domain
VAFFSDRLKELRKEKQLTQKDLANLLHMTERNYQKYELSEMDPVASKLIVLSNFYNVTIDYLLGHSDIKELYTKEEISRIKIVSDSLLITGKLENMVIEVTDKLENMATELKKIEQVTKTINRSINTN